MKTGTAIFASVALVVVLVAVFMVIKQPVQLSAVGGTNPTTGQPTNTIITSSTAVTYSATDKLNQGTAVGVTSTASVNDLAFASAPATASQGDKLIVLMNASGYHSAVVEKTIASKTTDQITGQLYANASTIAMTAFNPNNQVITGAVNVTASTGATYNVALAIDGSDKQATNDMRCILESNASTATDKVSLNGFGATYVGTAKPKWYSLFGTNSAVWVYDISPIVGAGRTSGTIIIQTASSQTLANSRVKITCVSKENFVDAYTGKLAYDVEDSQGNLKTIMTVTKTIPIETA